MYSTQKDLAAQFEYLSLKQTRTAIERLIEADYIKTGCFNRHRYDRTIWYTLTEKGETVCLEDNKLVPQRAKGLARGGATIPDIKTDHKKEYVNEKLAHLAQWYGAS